MGLCPVLIDPLVNPTLGNFGGKLLCRRCDQPYHARRNASARSSTLPLRELKRRGLRAVARSTAASLLSLWEPRCVAKIFLIVPAWTSTCFLWDQHCSTVCTIDRHDDSLILLSTNCRSITTRSAVSKWTLILSQKEVIAV